MNDAKTAIEEFLSLPPEDPRSVPAAEELVESLRQLVSENQALREYQRIRQELGPRPGYFIAPPNFPYVVHSA